MLKAMTEKPPELMERVYEFAKNPIGYFLLSGTNGNGKSYIAETLYYSKTDYVLPAYDSDKAIFITQAELNQEWNEKQKESPVFLSAKYKNVELLIVDDLGTRAPSSAFCDFLYLIFDYRWKNRDRLGTIITTNKSAMQIANDFGDAILSRIASGFTFRLEGRDRRACNF